MSADWSDEPDPVPYADFDNPQSLNMYTYAQNNPVSAVDDGHGCGGDSGIPCNTSQTKQIGPLPAGKCANWFACLLDKIFSGDGGSSGGSSPGNSSSDSPAGIAPVPQNAPNKPAPPDLSKTPRGTGIAMTGVLVCQVLEPCGAGLDTAVIGGALIVAIGVAAHDAYVHYHKSFPKPPPDASTSPGPGWEWRGGPEGSWCNPNTGESLRPDLGHPDPIGPHWDYKDPGGKWWRIFPDGRANPK